MAVKPTNTSAPIGADFEFLAAGTYDLCARPGKPQRCARRVVALIAGNWTMLRNSGEVDSPPGAVFQGFTHEAQTSGITSSAAIIVTW